MWQIISNLVTSKYGRLVCIFAWLTIPLVLSSVSPSLTEVSSSSQEDFLPVGVESTQAIKLQADHFPSSGTPGTLVYKRDSGLNEQDKQIIAADVAWLQNREVAGIIGEISSISQNPNLEAVLMSKDESTMMVFFSILTDEATSIETVQEEIRNVRETLVLQRDDDLQVWLTGPAGVLEDAVSVFQSVDFRITMFTVIAVLAILLIIYKAPFLAIFPVLSAGLAFTSASAIAALLAKHTGLAINQQATSIMVVLIFGAGTDYMLFISSRFKEQLRSGADATVGIAETMAKIGPAIFSSAATTILAMLALGLATLRSFQVLGPILALGMAFAILAGLTFIPAVLSLLGRKAYWPTKITYAPQTNMESQDQRGFWHHVGTFVERRYFVISISSVLILLLMSLGTLHLRPSFDLLASLPKTTESVQGYEVIKESFPSTSGAISPSSVFVVTNEDTIESLNIIETLSAEIALVSGVGRITSPSRPFGIPLDTTISEYQQAIKTLPTNTRNILLEQGVDAIPILVQSGQLAPDKTGIATSLGTTARLISDSGHVAKIEVVFSGDPGSLETLDKIGEIRQVLKKHTLSGLQEVLVGGNTAIQYDTKVANEHDIKLIAPIVLLIIFVILVILVKAIIAPLYLLGSVVLSFSASLGGSVLIFIFLLGHDGVGQGVPIFMFIFLVALGVDYNIYIISRVREESYKHGIRKGTVIAISSTGGVITSAGVILSATFVALATLPLRDLFQLGFVVSLGVFMDTFFVRGFIVPSFVMLLGKWSWWPFIGSTHKEGSSQSV